MENADTDDLFVPNRLHGRPRGRPRAPNSSRARASIAPEGDFVERDGSMLWPPVRTMFHKWNTMRRTELIIDSLHWTPSQR
jgi:hypothetical protein